MASLTRKVINGHAYYYVRHCQRVDGRPKIVKTTYLGSVDNIVQAVEGAKEPIPPKTAEITNLGDSSGGKRPRCRCGKQPGPSAPKTASCLSTLDDDQSKIYSALNLARYARILA